MSDGNDPEARFNRIKAGNSFLNARRRSLAEATREIDAKRAGEAEKRERERLVVLLQSMEFHRGKIAAPAEGPRWRVRHHLAGSADAGLFDIVGAIDEGEAIARVRLAYDDRCIVLTIERLD